MYMAEKEKRDNNKITDRLLEAQLLYKWPLAPGSVFSYLKLLAPKLRASWGARKSLNLAHTSLVEAGQFGVKLYPWGYMIGS